MEVLKHIGKQFSGKPGIEQDFTFFKVKLSQLVHINFQAGENSHSYFFLCVEGMTEGLSRKVLLFEIIYVTFSL